MGGAGDEGGGDSSSGRLHFTIVNKKLDLHRKGVGRGTLLIMFELSHALAADVTLNKAITVEFGVATPGLGVGHLAVPELTEHTSPARARRRDLLESDVLCAVGETVDISNYHLTEDGYLMHLDRVTNMMATVIPT
eukprot:COSAG02_NODE_40046_length_409_cov_2.135484_1_plen_135_part_11